MRRIGLAVVLALSLTLVLLAAEAHAQQPPKVHQIGVLIFGSPASRLRWASSPLV
jgi:hypothetical protein